MPSKTHSLTIILAVAVSSGACGAKSARAPQVTPQAPAEVAPPTPVVTAPSVDPTTQLLADADKLFASGQQELALGHLDRAKAEFNRALALLLESPQGARADARIREHFDRLVDRISALELNALATGDGFTEQHSEPASIDSLLAIETFDAPDATKATSDAVQADLEQQTHDIPIPLNERVLRYVELFQGRLREFLTEGLTRGAKYLPMIQSVFRAEGLPLDLAYVPLIESAFKPTALSKTQARGVWQFMRGTALENGLQHDWYIDERADPDKATRAAAKYLKTLYGMFDDWHLALASYNGGPGRMQRALKRSGRDDFWSLSATSRYLPRETREYVPMILAAVIIARNPAQYGFEITPEPTRATETVSLPTGVDLRRVAEWAGVPADEIQQLNPELRRWTTPLRGDEYDLNVPEGTAERVRDALSDSNRDALNALQWHTVKRGESLATIARKLSVSRADLAEANYLNTDSNVRAGQRLLIPRMPSAALLARAASGDLSNDAVAAVYEATPVQQESAPTRVVYRVRAGDTLYSIARKHGTTIDNIRSWNNLTSTRLNVGARLVILSSRAADAQQ
jgi:membrane-bound lytic murein transglycosylase D